MSTPWGKTEAIRTLVGKEGWDWMPYSLLERFDELTGIPMTAMLYRCPN